MMMLVISDDEVVEDGAVVEKDDVVKEDEVVDEDDLVAQRSMDDVDVGEDDLVEPELQFG